MEIVAQTILKEEIIFVDRFAKEVLRKVHFLEIFVTIMIKAFFQLRALNSALKVHLAFISPILPTDLRHSLQEWINAIFKKDFSFGVNAYSFRQEIIATFTFYC